ncbi:MAG: nuclear transport factor 2 family protein [Saprospiraceae bacterium]
MKNYKLPVLGFATILAITIGCNQPSNKTANETPVDDINTEAVLEFKKMESFGDRYAKAWSSQQPEHVAAFFSVNGSLQVNDEPRAEGREAIAKVAEGFMKAFPDMVVTKDVMTVTECGIEFHWTLTGTNTGPKGTGKKIRISGYEIWQMGTDGLIEQSDGAYDANEYNRQLQYGVAD